MHGNEPDPQPEREGSNNYNYGPDLPNERFEDAALNDDDAPHYNNGARGEVPNRPEPGNAALNRDDAPDYGNVVRGEVPNRPEPSRPGRLARLFSRSEASRREAFEKRPVPTPDASPEKRQAYLNEARKAGYDITADHLNGFLHEVKYAGKANVIGAALDSYETDGEAVLGKIFAKQNPEIAEQQRFEKRSRYDERSVARPAEFADMEFDAVFADEGRFDAAMDRVEKLKPLSPKASFAQFDAVQRTFRGVGVRLTVEDFRKYASDVKQNGASALQRPGADAEMSLGEKMLVDLQRSPEKRMLIGASAERWGHVLSKAPQIPIRDERWYEGTGFALPGYDPSAPPPADYVRGRGYIKVSEASRALNAPPSPAQRPNNPYGQRIPAPSEPPAERTENAYGNNITAPKATVTLDGVARPMPPGYRQDGKIVAIKDDAVFQATRAVRSEAGAGIETARYDLAEITQAMPREQLDAAMAQGHTISVRARAGQLEVVDLNVRQQSHEQSRDQSREQSRRPSLQVDR